MMTEKPYLEQEEAVDEHVASLEPNYIGVFWWLVGLTIAEIVVAVVPTGVMFPKVAQGALLILMALGKASFVALYFMHLKFEKPVLGIIAFTPLILCTLLILALLPDLKGSPHETRSSQTGKNKTVEMAAPLNDSAELVRE
ncbi:MAG: cytochrome C oxidase subunit IV family protein [bacterium]